MQRFAALGFPNGTRRRAPAASHRRSCHSRTHARTHARARAAVINRNEDFYATAARGDVPVHDVLVTNPPFSGDHKERILRFWCGGGGGCARQIGPTVRTALRAASHGCC